MSDSIGARQPQRKLVWITLWGLTCPLFAPCVASAQQRTQTAQKKTQSASVLDQAKARVQQEDPRSALELLQQADLHGPGAADVHMLKGICLAMLQQPVESATEFDQAIALRPSYAPAYFSAGLAFASFNNLEPALARLSTAMKLDPGLPGLRYNYALVLSRAGQFAESEKYIDAELAAKGPRSESVLVLMRLKARDVYYQKKWTDALDAYRKVLVLQPDWAEAYASIGEALFNLNRSQESLDALTKAVALDPENPAAHALLGKLYQDAGKQQEAIAEFEVAHRLRTDDREVIFRLFRIYNSKGDKENAARLKTDLEAVLASDRTVSDGEAKASVLNNTGIELEKKGDLAGALGHYDQAAKADVTNVVFQRNAALLLCRMGRTQEAIRRLRDILSLDADDAETLQILSVANELSANSARAKALPSAEASRQ